MKHARKRSHKAAITAVFLVLLLICLVGAGGYLVLTSSGSAGSVLHSQFDVNERSADQTPTPIIAETSGVKLHCPIASNDLTEVLFHQSVYPWAKKLTTKLDEADLEKCGNNKGTGRSDMQPTGDNWLKGSAIHAYRFDASTEMDTAIDCGGAGGTSVYAPVSGTVFMVKKYVLDGVWNDYEIHIHPEGHDDLDVVIIHIDKVEVSQGDTVEAGSTKLAVVREFNGEMDMQLAYYTETSDTGNHAHVQVNDMNYEGYRAHIERPDGW